MPSLAACCLAPSTVCCRATTCARAASMKRNEMIANVPSLSLSMGSPLSGGVARARISLPLGVKNPLRLVEPIVVAQDDDDVLHACRRRAECRGHRRERVDKLQV